MTSSDLAPGRNPPRRLPGWARLLLVLLLGLVTILAMGALAGFTTAMIEDGGAPRPRLLLVFVAMLLALGGSGWLCWRLAAPWRGPDQSAFDRRYVRMWVVLMALGLPIGLAVGIIDHSGSAGSVPTLFSNEPIAPGIAWVGALTLLLLLALSAVYYHRTIDDHEERAYLWGSTGAFYFVAAAMPVAWLLARAAIIAPVGIGIAMMILLAAFCVQSIIWAWIKFR